MDGNGRWAERRGLPRYEGHRRGSEIVRVITEECAELGLEYLTLYCLSSENWKRPKAEIDFLMELLKSYLISERPRLQKNNMRLSIIGSRANLPSDVIAEMNTSIAETASNTGLNLCLAINYGSRQEIVESVRRIVNDFLPNGSHADSDPNNVITEQFFEQYLYTANMPEPDLLIRTAGEMRLSNFLLWQLSYAEFWVTQTLWPDFTTELLREAIDDFGKRERRFGAILNS
jgi:undecaprenyl diphosphate synthase